MFFAIALVGLFGWAGFSEAHLTHVADACKILGIVSAGLGGVIGYAIFLTDL